MMKRLRTALDNQPSGLAPQAARSRQTLHIVLAVVLAVQIAGTAIVVGSAGDSWRLNLSASGDVEVRDFCPLPATIFGKGEFHTIIGDLPRPLPDDENAPPAQADPSESEDKRERPEDGHGGQANGPSGHVDDAQHEDVENDAEQRSEPIFISAGTMELGVFSLWLELSSDLPESYAAAPVDASTVRLIDQRLNRMIGPYAVARETGDENGNGQPDRRIDFVLDDLFVARGGESGSSLVILNGTSEHCDFQAGGQLLVDFPEPGDGEMPAGSSNGGDACATSEPSDGSAATATPAACSEPTPPTDAASTPPPEPTATAAPDCVPTPDAPCPTASPLPDATSTTTGDTPADATSSPAATGTTEATAEPTAATEEIQGTAESTPASVAATPEPTATESPPDPEPTAEPEATSSPDTEDATATP